MIRIHQSAPLQMGYKCSEHFKRADQKQAGDGHVSMAVEWICVSITLYFLENTSVRHRGVVDVP